MASAKPRHGAETMKKDLDGCCMAGTPRVKATIIRIRGRGDHDPTQSGNLLARSLLVR
jgi:hypothetical protein